MKKVTLLFAWFLLALAGLNAQKFSYSDSWGNAGFNLSESNLNQVQVVFSVKDFSLEDAVINGEQVKLI